jgi:hypothetical protein
VSSTTNDGVGEEAAPLAYAEDTNPPRASYAEDAKTLTQPVGVYGAGKFGECRSLTKEEIAAGADTPRRIFESDAESGLYLVDAEKTEA